MYGYSAILATEISVERWLVAAPGCSSNQVGLVYTFGVVRLARLSSLEI